MAVMTQTEMEEFLDRKLVTTLITLRADGSPHASPMWYLHKDGKFYSRCSSSSLKVKNIKRDPRVTLCVCIHDMPYKSVVVDGTCEIIEGEDRSKWPLISAKYLGKEKGEAYSNSNARRGNSVLLVISPKKIVTDNRI